jgi:hypothetical protein
MEEEIITAPDLLFYQLLLIALVLICFFIHSPREIAAPLRAASSLRRVYGSPGFSTVLGFRDPQRDD